MGRKRAVGGWMRAMLLIALVSCGSAAAQRTEEDCAEDAGLASATLNKFLFTLVTQTCDISAGWAHTCSPECQAAITDIATTAEGCLAYSSFGDGVFDSIRAAAAAAGLASAVPSATVMNMTQLVDWGIQYCDTSLVSGAVTPRACAEPTVYREASGVIPGLPTGAMDASDGTYDNWIRCLISVEPPLSPGQHIKLTVDAIDLDQGDSVTILNTADPTDLPLIVLSGSTPPDTPIYSPDGSDSLLIAFESDSRANDGSGFTISYEVSDEDLDSITGCNDPLATNYSPDALIPKTTVCIYDFDDGSMLFTGSTGHIDVPDASVPADHLPKREITLAAWVKINDDAVAAYTSYISHFQDDYTVRRRLRRWSSLCGVPHSLCLLPASAINKAGSLVLLACHAPGGDGISAGDAEFGSDPLALLRHILRCSHRFPRDPRRIRVWRRGG